MTNQQTDRKPPILRVHRSKAQARANYDRLSKRYDLISASEKPFIDLGLQTLEIKPGEIVLELGSGTGHAIAAMAGTVGEAGKVYGIDISAGMIQVALRKVERAGLSRRAALLCGDAARLPYRAGLFDAVFASFTLELFDTPEIPTVLGECRRVLKRTGRLCVVAMSMEDEPGLAARLYGWAHRRFPLVIDCRPIRVQDELIHAGLRVMKVVRERMWGLPLEIVLASPGETG